MLRAPSVHACVALFAVAAFWGSARAQEQRVTSGTVTAAPSPSDPTAPAATATSLTGPAVLDYIRRTFDRPGGRAGQPPSPPEFSEALAGSAPSSAALPVLLPPALWTGSVPGVSKAPHLLMDSVFRTRGSALFYYGLYSLDEETRAWLATHPPIVAELGGPAAAAFVVAAPGLRVRGTAIHVPGGAAARPAWEALVGHTADDPAGFTSALLRRDDGRLAYVYGAMAGLSTPQLHAAFRLDDPEPARVEAAKRLRSVFERVLLRWRPEDHVFWRPVLDPALLIAHLRTGRDGRPLLQGDRAFWRDVFDDSARVFPGRGAGLREGAGEPADFPWLADQVFSGQRGADRRRYDLVMLVSRLSARDPRWTTPAAIGAVRAAAAYPALMLSLERARIADLHAFHAAARRADGLAAIRDPAHANRALTQFQGTLALLLRAARGSAAPETLSGAVASLSAVELSDQGEYEGRMLAWIETWLAEHQRLMPAPAEAAVANDDLEGSVIAALAGPVDREPRFVEWEGTRYRLDLAAGESARLTRHLGERRRPWLSTARTLVRAAAASANGISVDEAARVSAALDEIAATARWDASDIPDAVKAPSEYREVRSLLRAASKRPDPKDAPRLGPLLLGLADDLLGRGLTEFSYAVALGHPDRITISAGEAAARHRFAPAFQRTPSAAWQLPAAAVVPNMPWHVTGSLLGLDVGLAELGLVRLSLKPPARKPTLSNEQRRVLVEAVPLVDARLLTDADRSAMLSAIRSGRARLDGVRTPEEAAALAADINLSPLRTTLLSWTVTAARERLESFFSPGELLWIGLGSKPLDASWDAWGMPAAARTGCLCLDLVDRLPWELFAGRPHSGAIASGFPELNLRLAELLDELQMPAALMGPVLGAATLDFVEGVAARDADDREALLDFVRRLRRERVEEYLALLTDDGPLVPVDPGDAR